MSELLQAELLRRLAELELRVELLARALGAVAAGALDRPTPMASQEGAP